jgi:signal transduction histidine kinase
MESGAAFGALAVLSPQADFFTEDDERLLASLAALAAVAVREARLGERLAEAEAVRELVRLKDEFLSTVSHELRTPLSVVCGYVELLMVRDVAPERAQGMLAEINRAAQLMARLVDDLLDLGRIERGDLHLELEHVDVAATLHDSAVRYQTETEQHHFQIAIEEPLPPALADPSRLRQNVDNLVENAVRYADPGTVVLRASGSAAGLLVEVEDLGPGMPPDVAARVFEKFYRAPQARLSRDRGTGIGLAVVKQLVEAHGGDVGVRPTPGGGSSFWFRLPTAEAPP